MSKLYVGVCLLGAPHSLDREFDYSVPEEHRSSVRVGSFVSVPFGRANKLKSGIVTSLKCETDAVRVKPLSSVSPDENALSEEMLALLAYLKEQTLCTTGDAARAMVPSPLTDAEKPGRVRAMRYYSVILSRAELEGLIEKREGNPYKVGSEGQRRLLHAFLAREGRIDEGTLMNEFGGTREQLKALVSRGILWCETETAWRGIRETESDLTPREITLSDEQEAVYRELISLFRMGEPRAALLHGVTGSGKTSVMLRLIDEVLRSGRSAIVMLPEIALTPQSLEIFCSRYGRRVAVIHSGLSAGERCDAYRRARSGDADLVIGTRSAVFAPVQNLGLIVMDEEQEHTYKSDMNPKYHARDVARFRCNYNKALLMLASATPSIESYKKACDGTYKLLTMKKRYGNAVLPEVRVVDMRAEGGNAENPFSTELARLVAETKTREEQSILFLNRRGYNHFLTCRTCGEVIRCERCSVSMTYHTTTRQYDRGELVCHFCGMRKPVPEKCPSCDSVHLARLGYGTQRVEQEIETSFPSIRILRMDTDTTGTKDSYDKILGAFRKNEADLLLGTQMVTKGHDFPNVTLVGVMNADASLYLDDYRASERTFAMLTQVIGRAGRSEKRGTAVIQTNNPDSDVIQLACRQDYPAFYEREIKLRRALLFPPFVDIVLLTLSGEDEGEVMRRAVSLRTQLEGLTKGEFSSVPVILFGPFEAPVYRAEGRYRMRIVVKCRLNRDSRALFSRVLDTTEDGEKKDGVSLSIDFNPSTL